jgi:hypothetical protein
LIFLIFGRRIRVILEEQVILEKQVEIIIIVLCSLLLLFSLLLLIFLLLVTKVVDVQLDISNLPLASRREVLREDGGIGIAVPVWQHLLIEHHMGSPIDLAHFWVKDPVAPRIPWVISHKNTGPRPGFELLVEMTRE